MTSKKSSLPDFSFETFLWERGIKFIAGVDEVGRGAFAGPVVVGSVVFGNADFVLPSNLIVNDSKKMKPRERVKAVDWIKNNALSWGIGEIWPEVINRVGIGKATRMAARRAVVECNNRLSNVAIEFLLLDAFYIPYVRGVRKRQQMPIIGGDGKSFSIAAASIIAKVHRDGIMREIGRKYKEYGWGRNKAYGTKFHQEAIIKYGVTRLHRKAFVATWMSKSQITNSKSQINSNP